MRFRAAGQHSQIDKFVADGKKGERQHRRGDNQAIAPDVECLFADTVKAMGFDDGILVG